MSGSGGLKSNACWSGSRNLSCSTSSVPSRASASNLTSSSSVSLRRFRNLAASLILLNEKSCNELRDAVRRYSIDTWLGTHHPLAVLSSKKNLRRVQTFALSTLPLATLSTLPTGVGAPNPMGQERKPFTIKLDADNSAWIDELQSACLPLEVSKSSLVNSLVTIARTQIQVTPASVQITPRNLSVNDLGQCRQEAQVGPRREPNPPQVSTGAEPRNADGVRAGREGMDTQSCTAFGREASGSAGEIDAPLAIEAAPIPLPQKLRRAERAS